MSVIITTPEQLEALPVGARLVDREGDTLRRTPRGWTYVAEGAVLNHWNCQSTAGVVSFMPMVTLDDSAASDLARWKDAALAKLDRPELHEGISSYLAREFPGAELPEGGDRYSLAARRIIQDIKEHLT